MGKIVHIKADGAKKEVPAYHPPAYADCREAIRSGTADPLIEIVKVIYENQLTQMIVHESGLIYDLPLNQEATELYRATICSKEEFDARMQEYEALGFTVIGSGYNSAPEIRGDVLLLVGEDVWLQ